MLLVYIGTYCLFLLFIWAFFLIARIHAYKFKAFSTHITGVSNILFVFLLTLSILGFVLIFMSEGFTQSASVISSSNPILETSY